MQGKILGVDTSGGALTGEDGKRYKFVLEQWKGARPPVIGETVDFELAGSTPTDIYPVKAGAAAGAAVDLDALGAQARQMLGTGASSPAAAKALGLLKSDLRIQLALVILIASVLFHFLVIGGGTGAESMMRMALPNEGKFTLVGISSAIDFAGTGLKTSADGLEQATQYMAGAAQDFGAGSPYAAQEAAQLAKTKAKISKLRTDGLLLNFLYILYLIPIGAIAILVQAFRGQSIALIALATGALSVVSFVLLLIGKGMVVGAFKEMAGGMGEALIGNIIHYGLGSYILLLAGLGMVAASLGLVKAPALKPVAT